MFNSLKTLISATVTIAEDVIDIAAESVGALSDCTNHAKEGMKTLRTEIQTAEFSDAVPEVVNQQEAKASPSVRPQL